MRRYTCPTTGKVSYICEQDAERALHSARNAARRLRRSRVKGIYRNEQRVAPCEDFDHWHLTSWSSKAYGIYRDARQGVDTPQATAEG